MGLDTTYVPVKEEDIEAYILDVIRQPELQAQKISQLSQIEADQSFLAETLYPALLGSQPSDPFDSHFGRVAGSILAHLHPYYYERGLSLAMLSGSEPLRTLGLAGLFQDFRTCFPDVISGNDSGDLNYRSGMFVPARHVDTLLNLMRQPEVLQCFDGEEPKGLIAALQYAGRHGTGVLETFDMVEPGCGEFYTTPYQLRAGYLGNLDDERNALQGAVGTLHIGFPMPGGHWDMDEVGRLTLTWAQQENLLPAIGEMDSRQRAVKGSVRLTLINQQHIPVILIHSEEEIYVPDVDAYLAALKTLVSDFLVQHGMDTRYFVSLTKAQEVPEAFRIQSTCQVAHSSKPRFCMMNQKAAFKVDDLLVQLELTAFGKCTIRVNDVVVETLKIKARRKRHVLFFGNGDWYGLTLEEESAFTGTLNIGIFKNIYQVASYRLIRGSERFSRKTNFAMSAMEYLFLFTLVLSVMMPRPAVMIPCMIVFSLMRRLNKRHHIFLEPLEIGERD